MIITGIIIAIISTITNKIAIRNNYVPLLHFSTIIFIISIILIIKGHYNIPKAIDVYRGNTTLEIIYKDGVPVDTVVIFKE